MKIRLEGGQLIEAEDKREVVEVMAKMAGEEPIEKYMKGVAHRCKIWNRDVIQYTDVETFFDEMVRTGVIVEVM